MIRAGDAARVASMAASIVYPVARPSSTRIAVRPAIPGPSRPPVNFSIRSSTFFLAFATAAFTSVSERPSPAMRERFRMARPSQVTAPNPASGFQGIWTFRTTAIRSGAFSTRATSSPTGTPPAGMAETTASVIPSIDERVAASLLPASVLSSKTPSLSRIARSSMTRLVSIMDQPLPHWGINVWGLMLV